MTTATTYNNQDNELSMTIGNDDIQSLTIDGVEVSIPAFEAAYGDTVGAFMVMEF